MASLVKDLVEAGIHFGHRCTNWNPKMLPYIHGKKNKIHIIDVKATVKGLLLARKFLTKVVAEGKDVLFVGTKRQARGILEKYVGEAGQHYVIERWLGGTLTNFRTIRDRLKRLEELEAIDSAGDMSTSYSKKMESTLRREKAKILRNLSGIRNMTKLPGAMVVIDVKREANAVREARKLGIPTVCLIDTDSDPDFADIPIPGNDDAMRSIEVVVQSLVAAVNEGKTSRQTMGEGKDDGGNAGNAGGRGRRSIRAKFRSDEKSSPSASSSDDVESSSSSSSSESSASASSAG
jgi:small subunit ribosomal protein S2